MGKDMTNDSKDHPPKNSNFDANASKQEDTNPIEPGKEKDSGAPIEDTHKVSGTGQGEFHESEENREDISFPEWINHLWINNGEDETDLEKIPTVKKPSTFEQENPVSIPPTPGADSEIEPEHPNSLDQIEEEYEVGLSGDDGYIEISEFDLSESPEPAMREMPAIPVENQGLPDWLKDMIEEPSAIQPGQDEVLPQGSGFHSKDALDDSTQPIHGLGDVPSPKPAPPIIHPQTHRIGHPRKEDNDSVESAPRTSYEFSDTFSTQPIPTDVGSTVEDYLEPAHDQPDELPKTLSVAKHLLQKNEFKKAKNILIPFIGQAIFAEEIERWLQEAAQQNDDDNPDLLELIGDLAWAKDEPEKALNAYSQAVTSLITRVKD